MEFCNDKSPPELRSINRTTLSSRSGDPCDENRNRKYDSILVSATLTPTKSRSPRRGTPHANTVGDTPRGRPVRIRKAKAIDRIRSLRLRLLRPLRLARSTALPGIAVDRKIAVTAANLPRKGDPEGARGVHPTAVHEAARPRTTEVAAHRDRGKTATIAAVRRAIAPTQLQALKMKPRSTGYPNVGISAAYASIMCKATH